MMCMAMCFVAAVTPASGFPVTQRMTHLNVSYNRLRSFVCPSDAGSVNLLTEWPALRELNANWNNLADVEWSLPSLASIMLSNNLLSGVPLSVSASHGTKAIDISNNRIPVHAVAQQSPGAQTVL